MKAFHFGTAAADITPPVGIHMGGYWGRNSGATRIHDRLMAKALVCALGETKMAIVSVDLVALDADSVQEIRARIERDTGLASAAVMICASHTHAGPLTIAYRGMGEVDDDYLRQVQDTVVGVVAAATADCQEGRLRYVRPQVQIGLNRREQRRRGIQIGQNATGSVVPYAHVLCCEAADGRSATLFSHACHPVVLGSDNHQISGDFAGVAARHIERETGGIALFVNGACGDINPRITGGSFGDVDTLGRELSRAVLESMSGAESLALTELDYAQKRVDLPLIDPPDRLRAEAEKLKLHFKAELLPGEDEWAKRVPKARLEWAEEMLMLVRGGIGSDRVQPCEIQALVLGPLVILGIEGEIFARYQLDLEAEWGPAVLCGFANGCIGYVPTADEYPLGGYEIDEAYKVYPSVQMIAPESDALIRREVGELIARLRA